MRARLALAFIAAAVPLGAAADFVLDWPVDCVLGESCHIQNHVDHDPGPGWRDFACHALSYDGHTGTDIALATRSEIARGVPVLAAAAGQVAGVRDGMPDRPYRGEALDGRDCGTGVRLLHDGGWETQYCHLRRGSVAVAEGDIVRPGDKLGEIGLSGRTEFAHLHLSVRKDGEIADPFAPQRATASTDACRPAEGRTLWRDAVAHGSGALLDAGFATRVPDYEAVKDGTATTPLRRDAPLVLFGYGYGMRAGDAMRLRILGPDGVIFETQDGFDRARAQAFRAGGRRAPDAGWPPGRYLGEVTLLRDGAPLSQRITRRLLP